MRVNQVTGHTVWPLEPKLLRITDKYQEIYYAPDLGPLVVSLAAYAACRIEGIDPVWLMLVGGPSTGKTEIVNLLRDCPNVYQVSTITPAGLLSGTRAKDRAKDATGGLLNAIGASGFIAFKDFTSIIGMKRDQQAEVLDALREIYDGHWSRHVGTDGGRTLFWSGRIGVLAACTDVIDDQRRTMAAMGDRFLYFRMPVFDADQGDQMAERACRNMGEMDFNRHGLRSMVEAFMADIPQVKPPQPSEDYRYCIAGLSNLTAICRSDVRWDYAKRHIEDIRAPEGASRINAQLSALDAGLALIGVPEIWRFNLLRRTALYSVSSIRMDVLNALSPGPRKAQAQTGKTVAELKRQLDRYGQWVLYRTVEELEKLGLIRPDKSEAADTVMGRPSTRWTMAADWLERWNRTPDGSVVSKDAGGVVELPVYRQSKHPD